MSSVNRVCISLALLLAFSFHFTLGAASAAAQDLTIASAQELGPREHEQAFERKQRRLNIAGWTLVGAGAAFPVIGELHCLAEAGSCSETSCFAPDDACQLPMQAPDISLPEALEPTRETCERWADCDVVRFEAERDA